MVLNIKDFRTTTTSYNLVLEDSETHELSEKVYNFNDDEFGGVSTSTALKLIDDVRTGKYGLTLSINVNNMTAALLNTVKDYKHYDNVLLDFYKAKNASSPQFAKKYYGYYYGKNDERIYIADYAIKGNKFTIITVSEKFDRTNDAIAKHYRNLIKKTGKLNSVKLRKFNRVQFLAMMILTRRFKTDVFRLY